MKILSFLLAASALLVIIASVDLVSGECTDCTKYEVCGELDVCTPCPNIPGDHSHCILTNGAICAVDGSKGTCDSDENLECHNVSLTCGCKAPTEWNAGKSKCQSSHGWECRDVAESCVDPAQECVEGVCRCKGEGTKTTWYNSTACILYTDQPCLENPTASDATCNEFSQCAKASNSPDHFCKCNPNSHQGPTCTLTFGQSCLTGRDLCERADNLVCSARDNTCGCDENNSVWDRTNRLCKRAHGKGCGEGRDCGRDATCEFGSKTCRCDKDFEPNSVGLCVIPDGKSCEATPEDSERRTKCDIYEGGQVCSPSTLTCTCPEEMEYDSVAKKCILQREQDCERDNQCPEYRICDPTSKLCVCNSTAGMIEDKSINGGECVVTWGYPCTQGNLGRCSTNLNLECIEETCQCQSNYTLPAAEPSPSELVLSKCMGVKGAFCVSTLEDCFLDGSFRCRGKECDCFYPGQFYDAEAKRCYSLVGQTCDIEPNENQSSTADPLPYRTECDKNMDCTLQGGQEKCACKKGFINISLRCNSGNGISPNILLYTLMVLALTAYTHSKGYTTNQ